jgi:hypothetical protein
MQEGENSKKVNRFWIYDFGCKDLPHNKIFWAWKQGRRNIAGRNIPYLFFP